MEIILAVAGFAFVAVLVKFFVNEKKSRGEKDDKNSHCHSIKNIRYNMLD